MFKKWLNPLNNQKMVKFVYRCLNFNINYDLFEMVE